MNMLNPNTTAYAQQLRVRVCGICLNGPKLLLVRHDRTINNEAFWAPPGGGLNYGETIQECLKREIKEETGLEVQVGRFLFVNEFLQEPLHAIELFFEVTLAGGTLKTGTDPEAAAHGQIIQDVQFLTLEELRSIPTADKHRILQHLYSFDDLFGLSHHFLDHV